jgi:hypothetical protein
MQAGALPLRLPDVWAFLVFSVGDVRYVMLA